MDKQRELDQMKADILKKNICPDLAKTATKLVMGDGDLDAGIFFIGEAPGKKEDEVGLPFMGAAGRFLNQMLEAAEMQRSDVYITNIVKYRPPENRDPTKVEKAAFLPYLLQEIEIIKPKVVITLGRHSMEYFLPSAKIGEVHGQPQQVKVNQQDILLIPLFHPAAALFNGSLRQTLINDFLEVPKLIQNV